jgi:hypothetical protein
MPLISNPHAPMVGFGYTRETDDRSVPTKTGNVPAHMPVEEVNGLFRRLAIPAVKGVAR